MEKIDLEALIPEGWLEEHWTEYLSINERITLTVIRVKASQRRWPVPLVRPQDFEDFFKAEADKFGTTVGDIKGFIGEIAQTKAKEQVFQKYYGALIPKDSQGKPLITRKDLDPYLGPAVTLRMPAAEPT